MATHYVLALDIGSSGVRSAIMGSDGSSICSHQVDYRLRYLGHGGSELGPALLLRSVVAVIDRAVADARAQGTPLHAVGLCTMWHGVCGVDSSGRATVPVIPWSDRRSASAAAELRSKLDDLAQHSRTGTRIHPMYWPAKLLWLSKAQPGAFDRTTCFLSPGDYVYRQFFGRASISVSMASATGLMNQHSCDWDDEVVRALPLGVSSLPPLSDEADQGLRPPWSARWPELADLPWFPGIGDGAASSIGAGCTGTSRFALMLGTSGALRALYEGEVPKLESGLFCYRASRHQVVVGGGLNDGGNLVEWLRSALRLPGLPRAERELIGREPGAHGLTVLPFLAGERSPGWSDNASGAIIGLDLATRPVDILHAALESVALRFLAIYRQVTEVLSAPSEVVATGTALLQSPVWAKMIADALGLPVIMSAVPNASLRGTALFTLNRLGAIPSVAALAAPIGDVVKPSPARHAKYLSLLERQEHFYQLLVAEG